MDIEKQQKGEYMYIVLSGSYSTLVWRYSDKAPTILYWKGGVAWII